MLNNKLHKFHIDNNYIAHPLVLGDITLIQLGRCYCKPEFQNSHVHENYFELTVIHSGKGVIVTNETEVNVQNGDIHFSGPFETHGTNAVPSDPMNYDFFAFRTENQEFLQALTNILRNHPTAASRIYRSENVSSLVANAIWELHNEEYCSKGLLRNMFEQIIIYTIRAFQPQRKKNPCVMEAVNSEILCYQIMNYIDNNIYSIKKLSEIVEEFNYNYSYLSHLFKVNTGRSVMDYFCERRLELAKSLIVDQKMSITKVADKLNYPSLYSFSRMFKKRYGCSPDAYRRNCSETAEEKSTKDAAEEQPDNDDA